MMNKINFLNPFLRKEKSQSEERTNRQFEKIKLLDVTQNDTTVDIECEQVINAPGVEKRKNAGKEEIPVEKKSSGKTAEQRKFSLLNSSAPDQEKLNWNIGSPKDALKSRYKELTEVPVALVKEDIKMDKNITVEIRMPNSTEPCTVNAGEFAKLVDSAWQNVMQKNLIRYKEETLVELTPPQVYANAMKNLHFIKLSLAAYVSSCASNDKKMMATHIGKINGLLLALSQDENVREYYQQIQDGLK